MIGEAAGVCSQKLSKCGTPAEKKGMWPNHSLPAVKERQLGSSCWLEEDGRAKFPGRCCLEKHSYYKSQGGLGMAQSERRR